MVMITPISVLFHSIAAHREETKQNIDSPMCGIRYQLLTALKMLDKGHHIYVMSHASWDIHLYGCHHVAALLKFLVDYELVEEANPTHWAGGFTLKISERGSEYFQKGMEWWDSLSKTRKFLLIVSE